jgi:integrase
MRHPVTCKPITRRKKGLKSKAEALRAEKDLVLVLDGLLKAKVAPSWRDAVAEFIAQRRADGAHINTIDCYTGSLHKHTMEEWGNRLVSEITAADVTNFIKVKLASKKPATRKSNLKYIRGVFEFALARGYIQRSPVPKMQFPIGDRLKGTLTEEQVKILLTRARDIGSHWYPVWLMAVYTGMRSGELFALRWSKVDFENNLIKVDESWSSKVGFKTTKSGHDRWVDIAPSLLPFLKELKLQTQETGFVLPRIAEWERGLQARELAFFLQGIGFESVRFHDLRATWATVLLNKGVPPLQVMVAGGWRNLKTMQEYIRKAGVNVRGVCAGLSLHAVQPPAGKVIPLRVGGLIDGGL